MSRKQEENYLTFFKKELKKKAPDPKKREELYEEILDYFQMSDKNFEEKLRGRKVNWDSSRAVANRNNLIRLLYFAFGIPYTNYLDEDKVETNHSPCNPKNSESVFVSFEEIDNLTAEKKETEFEDKYLRALTHHIKGIKSNLWVYDYISRGRLANKPGESIPYYSKAHNKVYKLIEEQIIENPEIDYRRYLVLPVPENWDEWVGDNLKMEKAIDVFIRCSTPTFAHICHCLNLNCSAKFFIVWRPTRIFHYGIIDSKCLVLEHYRYKFKGDFVPDMLSIEPLLRNDNKLTRKIDIYTKEFENIAGNLDRSHEIDRPFFIDSTKKACGRIVEKLRELSESNADWDDRKDKKRKYWLGRKEKMLEKLKSFNDCFAPDEQIPETILDQ